MNEKKKMQPKVRFREFTGENASDWEQRKFRNFIVKSGAKNKNGENYPAYSVSNQLGLVLQSEQFDGSRLDNLDKTSYKIVYPDEFVYNPARINVGSIAFNNLEKIVIVSSLYVVLKISEKIDNKYILQYIKSSEFTKEIKRNTEGSVREYLFFENFCNVRFPYSINIKEQKKIGNLFERLDKLITLHQRKLEQLEQLKNTLLSKMFPKSGTNIPEIRFSGFTDAWKHHKLGNTIEKNSLRNKDLLINNVESVSNKYGFIRQTEQFDDYTVASNDLSNYYIILEKYFAYNPSRINVGSIAYKTVGSPISIVSPLYVSFTTKDMIDDRFLWYWFKTNEFKQQREKYSEGGVRDTLSYNQLSKMNILLPELNEQIKIGKYIDSLTKTIAIHQRKLEQLKNLKQTLLNKMFV